MASNKQDILFPFLIIVALIQFQTFIVIAQPQVPCYFIFGDSLVDNGNNNRLVTRAKVNYPPYGIDFSQGVTGRATNGRTSADIIGELLGFTDFIPSYASVSTPPVTLQEIVQGVNYGSGSAGIRPETGIATGDRINLDTQLLNHALIVSRLRLLQRNITFTNEYLSKCIYTVNMGTNDYLNYFTPAQYITGRLYTPERFAELLIRKYTSQLRTLYTLGARRVALFGLLRLGCGPAVIAALGTNGSAPCVESVDNAVQLFNDRLRDLVIDLNNALPNSRFTFINITGITTPPVGVVPNVPCCQLGPEGLCVPNSIPCPDRSLFIWYDGIHPTERLNTIIATRSYNAQSPTDTIPLDINRLAQV